MAGAAVARRDLRCGGGTRRRSSQVAANCPAILLAFDRLECAGIELLRLPLIERRHRLEDLLHDLHPCLQLILQTSDPGLACDTNRWSPSVWLPRLLDSWH